MISAGAWTWLEIAKIAATPATAAALAFFTHRIAKRFEHGQWKNQKLIEKRIAIYDDMAPLLNQLLCYFTYVGTWAEHQPVEIIDLKRDLDIKIYLAAPLISSRLFDDLLALQSQCFSTFNGWGEAARLNTDFEERKSAHGHLWELQWEKCFNVERVDPSKVKEAYTNAMNSFKIDIQLQR